jgi:hypothetical protein
VCGRSHELIDAWTEYQGRPACGECSRLIERAKVPGNRSLSDLAHQCAARLIPERADVSRFGLARDMPSYRPLSGQERREPWSYVIDLPPAPLTPDERLAELEKRLVGVTG